MKRVMAILIDALRYDYFSAEATPFLHSLGKQGSYGSIRPILGYSNAIDATIFTSTYPDRHNYWMIVKYSPETSPFKSLTALAFLDHLPENIVRRGFKYILSRTYCRLVANRRGYAHLGTYNIPFGVLDNFDYSLKKPLHAPDVFDGLPTIFDLFRNNGIDYSYLDLSDLGLKYFFKPAGVERKAWAKLAETDSRFYFLYIPYLDFAAHRFKVDSKQLVQSLKATDAILEYVITNMRKKFGDELEVMIFSDHGMLDTKDFVSFEWLKKINGYGRDFLFFTDSTMVRLWYFNEKTRDEIRERFRPLGFGEFLSERDKAQLGINFRHRLFGDDIYLLKEGYNIFPNFMSWLKPYAMHAYHPDYPHQQGLLVLNGKELAHAASPNRVVELVEIAPTILDLLGLRKPESWQGKSLLG